MFNIEINEFVAATVLQNEQYIMKWIIGTNKNIDTDEAAKVIDTELCNNNKNYAVARTKALRAVEVETAPLELFYKWSEEFKKLGGQAKIPRVMTEEDFAEFRAYVQQLV